jgi:predicted N-acetyltransferase YhbS
VSGINYRLLEDKDKESVLSLFKEAFGKSRDSRQWVWEFTESPEPAIIVVAEADNKIVGHYAILPRRFKVGNSVLEGGLVVDVMTHPMYGKRGIFVNSGLEAFKQAEEAGMKMLIGFPNEAAIRGHMKVGWKELGTVTVCARPIRASSIKSFLGERLKLPGISFRLMDVFLEALNRVSIGIHHDGLTSEWIASKDLADMATELDALRKKSVEIHTICNARDMDWMSWRVSDPLDPTHILLLRKRRTNEPVGLGLLKVKEKDGMKTGAVMDIWVPEEECEIADRLLRELLQKAIAEGCELMILFGSPSARRSRLMRRLMILRTPRKLRFIVRAADGKPLPEEASRLGNWHLELIDHDVM